MKAKKFLKEAERQCEIAKKYYQPYNLCTDATSRAYNSIQIAATYAVWQLLTERGKFKKPNFKSVDFDNIKKRKLGCSWIEHKTTEKLRKLEYRDDEVDDAEISTRYSNLIMEGSWIEYCDWKKVEKSIKELKKLIRDIESLLPSDKKKI